MCDPGGRGREELWRGCRWAAGLAGEHVGGLARRREPDHSAALRPEAGDGRRGGCGLAGARRARPRAPAGQCPRRPAPQSAWTSSPAAAGTRPMAWRRAQRSSLASWSRIAGVVRCRSVTCSVTGRPSTRRAAHPLGPADAARGTAPPPRRRVVDQLDQRSARSRRYRRAGGWRSPGPGRPAARSTPCWLTRWIASAITASRSILPRPGSPHWVGCSDRASNPRAAARSRHSARSALGVGHRLFAGSARQHRFTFEAGDRPWIGIGAVVFGGPAGHQRRAAWRPPGWTAGRTRR